MVASTVYHAPDCMLLCVRVVLRVGEEIDRSSDGQAMADVKSAVATSSTPAASIKPRPPLLSSKSTVGRDPNATVSVAASPAVSKTNTPQRRASPPSSANSASRPAAPPAPLVPQSSFRQSAAAITASGAAAAAANSSSSGGGGGGLSGGGGGYHSRKRTSVDFSLMRKVFDEIDTDKSQKIDEGRNMPCHAIPCHTAALRALCCYSHDTSACVYFCRSPLRVRPLSGELINGLQKLGVGVTPHQLKRIVKAFRKSELRRGHQSNPMTGGSAMTTATKPFTFGGGDASGGGGGGGGSGKPVMGPGMLKRGDTVRGIGMLGKQGTSSNLFAGLNDPKSGGGAGQQLDSSGRPIVKWELDFNEFKRFVAFSEQDEKKDHIKVAVRMRPFSVREKSFGSKACVSMDDGLTTVTDPAKSGKVKTFDMDYTYNSSQPGDHFYAHQRFVCQEMVSDILDEALQGFNVTVFAYGQTGAGKSYTMFGDVSDTSNYTSSNRSITAKRASGALPSYDPTKTDQRGVIPHFCDQLFEYTKNEAKEKNESYKVRFQQLISTHCIRDDISA